MMRNFSTSVFLLLFLAVNSLTADDVSATASSVVNHMKNPELCAFDLRTGHPEGWYNRPKLSGLRIPNPDDPEQFALELASPSPEENAYWVGRLCDIQLGQKYQVKVKVKVPIDVKFRVYVERSKPSFKAFNGASWQNGNGQWQQIAFTFKYEQLGAQPYLVFCVKGTTESYATDFEVQSAGTSN